MTPAQANDTLLMAFTYGDYARLEYYKKVQKESGISEDVFLRMLIDAYDYWWAKIEKIDHEWSRHGNKVSGGRIPFYSMTNTGLRGHFGHKELKEEILPILSKWANEINNKMDEQIHSTTEGDQIQVAAHAFVILWELGLIDALKEKGQQNYSELGKFLEVITGKKSGDFRKAISNHDPSTHDLFNEKSLQSAAKILDSYKIKHPRIDKKIREMKK